MKKKRDRRIVTFCTALGLAVMLAVGLAPVRAAAKQAEPVQTELNRQGAADLVINNAKQMKAFASSVNSGNKYEGKLVVLGADIVFDGKPNEYTPISEFSGTFDGQGHSISGIKVVRDKGAALFSYSSGVIENVTVTNCYFEDKNTVNGYNVAGLVGYNQGMINNCAVTNTQLISVNSYVGGIAGWSERIVQNCYVSDVSIVLSGGEHYTCVGGIVGWNEMRIQNCYVSGKSSVQVLGKEYTYAGGIVGWHKGDMCNCVNTCPVTSRNENAALGGIAGHVETECAGGNIENCYNSGTINGTNDTDHIGGIAGEVYSGNIRRCYTLDTAAQKNFGTTDITPLECGQYSAKYMQSQAFANQLNKNRGSHSDWRPWEIRSSESPYPLLKMPVNLNKCAIAPIAKCVYNGKEQKPDVAITYNGYKLRKDVDYTVKYTNNTKIGTATVEISGKGDFTGSAKRNFVIEKPRQTFKYTASCVKAFAKGGFDLKVKRTKGNGALTYTSSNKKVITVNKKGHVTMKNVGKAQITVKAAETSNYKATSVKISVTVKPAKVKITSVQVKGRRILAKWKKGSHVKGYQLQYSTSKKFKSNVKTVTLKKKTKVSYKSKKLKKGKTYYVRVRAYKGNLYGAWSKKMKVKVKR